MPTGSVVYNFIACIEIHFILNYYVCTVCVRHMEAETFWSRCILLSKTVFSLVYSPIVKNSEMLTKQSVRT